MAALSAVGFPIIAGSAIELSTLRPTSGAASQAAVRDATTALSQAALWSTTAILVSGVMTTLVLRDASGAVRATFTVPARAVSAVGLRRGDSIRTTATEAGVILHKDDRVLAFVAKNDQQHLVQHVVLAPR
ncbi:MAG TPA: hypothetical protein VJ890_10380 [Vineibacter sp.]|nr:hypothetical protein [Vineibacter sp.]